MSVSATSTPVTETRGEAVETVETTGEGRDDEKSKREYPNLAQIPCIWYPITFRKKSMPVSALLDSGSKVNAIYPTFARELGLLIKTTDIGAQKIDSTILDTFGMVVAAFSVTNKANRVRFFEKTFLVANVSPEVVLRMLFLTLNSANIDFLDWELWWKTYTTKGTLPTTRRIELVDKKEFAATALNLESGIFIVHITSLSSNALPSSSPLNVYPSCRPQISGLIIEEAPTKVSIEYLDFADVFSPDLASKLSEYTEINNHAIELVDSQQPPYGLIYNLGPVGLETLKAYIETNLANGFIKLFKSPAGALIMFNQKSNDSLQLYVDYWGLNNLAIKNQYPLPLIGELLDRLKRAKRFTQLNLTSAFHQMRICEADE